MTHRGAVLIRREVRPPRHALIAWTDLAVLAWLAVGLVVAPLRRGWRWRLCGVAARFSRWTRRARAAHIRMLTIGRLAERDVGRILRELYAGRFLANLDVVRGLVLGPDMRAACSGLARIDAARTQGRGVILWVSDFVSAGDVTKVALAGAGYRVVHLSRPEHGFTTSSFGIRLLNPLRIRLERAYVAERVVFDRMNPRPAMTRLLACLRAGAIISITASAHEGGTLIELPFMAGRLTVAAGALRLAWLSGASVIPVFVLRDPGADASFLVELADPLKMPAGRPESEALLAAACDFRDRLEAVVRARPECWVGWRRADQLAARPSPQNR